MSDCTAPATSGRDGPRFAAVARWTPIVLLSLYAATFLIFPKAGFWINDNGCKFIEMQGIVRSHYRAFFVPWPGGDLDPTFAYNPLPDPFGHVVDGRLYAQYSPVFPLLSSFFYRLLGDWGLYLLPLTSGLLTLAAVWCLVGRLTRSRLAGALAMGLVGLATPMWFYSMTFWELTPAACLTTWSLVFLLGGLGPGGTRRLWPAAVLCGLAIYFRDELYLLGGAMALVVVLYGRRRWRGGLLFAAVLLLTLVPLWWFQWLALGHPLGLHAGAHGAFHSGLLHYLAQRWVTIRNLLVDSHGSLAISLLISAPYLLLMVSFPRLGRGAFDWAVPLLAAMASVGGAIILIGHLTTDLPIAWLLQSNGLFAASPVLILAFVRPKSGPTEAKEDESDRTRRTAQKALWMTFALYVLLYVLAAPGFTTGGIHWGCRHLLPAYPMLGALAATALAQWWQQRPGRWRLGAVPVAIAVVLSIFLQVYSLRLLVRRKAFSAELNRIVAQHSEEVVITDDWFMPQELFRSFYNKPIFLVTDRTQMESMRSTLARAGYHRALYVGRPTSAAAARPRREIIDDGLGFLAVEVRPIVVMPIQP